MAAVEGIAGEELRLDTTAVETNVYCPSDSSPCLDVYRVLARHIKLAREVDPEVVGDRRLEFRTAKRHAVWITRNAGKKRRDREAFQRRYKALFGLVEGILAWAREVQTGLGAGLRRKAYDLMGSLVAEGLVESLDRFLPPGDRVLDQGRHRVLAGEIVPADKKLYSIFGPHTELLRRGKAGRPIAFGHMVLLQQVKAKYITDFAVFRRLPKRGRRTPGLGESRIHASPYGQMRAKPAQTALQSLFSNRATPLPTVSWTTPPDGAAQL